MDTPKAGRIVHYTLTEQDAAEINRRRTSGPRIAERLTSGHWPEGAQAHIGNQVSVGQVVPAMIVAVWHLPSGRCNLKCFLDGTDEFWATSREVSSEPETAGYWNWPPRD